MNVDCMEMRRRIESSIGYALEPDERDKIERHCAACESCRAYRERLLKDHSRLAEFAAPRDESIRRVQERAIERVRAAEWAPRGRASADCPRLPRIAGIAAAAAAAVIVAFIAIDLIRGAANGPVPAFAAVQEKMQKADNVVNRVRLWRMGEWMTYTESTARPWRHRRDFEDSVLVHGGGDRSGSTELRLYPSEKRAVLSRVVYKDTCSACWEKRKERPDAVGVLTGWYKQKGFVFRSKGTLRRQRDGGLRETAEFRQQPDAPSETSELKQQTDASGDGVGRPRDGIARALRGRERPARPERKYVSLSACV